jgi:hypothetical protein
MSVSAAVPQALPQAAPALPLPLPSRIGVPALPSAPSKAHAWPSLLPRNDIAAAPASCAIAPSLAVPTLHLQHLAQQMLVFATQQATLFQQVLPFMLPVTNGKVNDKLSAVLASLKAGPVLAHLKDLGWSDFQAQKACVEYRLQTGSSEIQLPKFTAWLDEQLGMINLDRCVSMHISCRSILRQHVLLTF